MAIKEVGFDFSWDEKKVWELELPTETINIEELTWHFDVPFLWSKPDGYYDLTPREVLDSPDSYPEEHQRMLEADTCHPIDIMFWKERWVILDGLHRLMKASAEGRQEIEVRKIPKSAIHLISK